MNNSQKYYPFFSAAILMWLALWIIYPFYQYYIDPDGTAYLTISKRYANGDIQRAINGYWSPWACWLTAGLIKIGLEAIPASVVINALGATGFLFISQSFFVRFDVERKIQWMLNFTLAFFLCYAIFWQSFDDLWECFFLLSCLRLMLVQDFKSRPMLWVLCGITGTLAYFAKAYSFPFFILNTACCAWLLTKGNRVLWIKISVSCITVMILGGLPWIIALHSKYGIWTTSTSGSLNMSWYLVGHPHWKPGIDLLIPPPYPDSPYYWEDPWFANGYTPHFWDSAKLFADEIIRTGYHILLFLKATIQLSIFFPLITIIGLLSLILKKVKPVFDDGTQVLLVSFLLFPLGYVLINFEARYLWYMVPLSMVLGDQIIKQQPFKIRVSYKTLSYLLPISYLLVPAIGLYSMYNSGKTEYELAKKMKASGIHGSFTSNGPHVFMERMAYFSGNQYYFMLPAKDGRTRTVGLFEDLNKYRVNYYFHYSSDPSQSFWSASETCEDGTFLMEQSSNLKPVQSENFAPLMLFALDYKQ